MIAGRGRATEVQVVSPAAAPVNVQEFINSHPVSRFQILVICICFLIVSLDGFDSNTLGYIAPAILKSLRLNPAQLSPLFALSQLGGMLGAFLFGPLADRWGRKTVIAVAVAWFGVFSTSCAYATSIEALVALRFLTGIGLGGAVPNAVTLTSEYCPENKRSFLVTMMFVGFAIAGAIGGLVAAQMVLAWGWHSVFWYGGVVPLVVAPLALLCLPESVRYLVMRGTEPERIARVLQRIAPGADVGHGPFVMSEKKLAGFPVKHLFRRGLFGGTVLLWVTFCANSMALYFIASWLPTMIQSTGGSLTKASILTSTFGTGVVTGAILLGYLMDRLNPYYVLAAAMLVGSIAIPVIGYSTAVLPLLVIALIFSGLGTAGANTGLSALAAWFYPTASRATGVSWAMAIGRIGSLIGGTVGGFMLAAHWGLPKVFLSVAIPLFVAAASMLLMYTLPAAKAAVQHAEVARSATVEG